MKNAYKTLLKTEQNAETFVKNTMALLEKQLQEIALLALHEWVKCNIASKDLLKPLGSLYHPAWGAWNGLLNALRIARNEALRIADKPTRERIHKATILTKLLGFLEQNIKNADTQHWLNPLYKNLLNGQKLPRNFSLQALFSAPINQRNYISHFHPSGC